MNKKSKTLTLILFFIYITALSWIILFKMSTDFAMLFGMKLRNINLIPFAGSAIVNGKADISEIVLNILAFVPFGLYMSMLYKKAGFLQKVLPIAGVSLLYETMQFVFAIGASDITDLIGNTLGGVLGIGFFAVLSAIFGKKTIKILNILASIATAAAILFLGLLIAAN